jgi:hypothetical protein
MVNSIEKMVQRQNGLRAISNGGFMVNDIEKTVQL